VKKETFRGFFSDIPVYWKYSVSLLIKKLKKVINRIKNLRRLL
jgi:hypothetical protein